MNKIKNGFTLVELMVVLAIVGLLVAFVFVALNPADRLEQAQDAMRQTDVEKILSSLEAYQADHEGNGLSSVAALTPGNVYMIVDGEMTTGCDDNTCDTAVSADTNCVNLAGLVDQYLEDVPISPAGVTTWDDGSAAGEEGTGYTLERETNGVIRIRACESEDTTEIEAAR